MGEHAGVVLLSAKMETYGDQAAVANKQFF